MKTKAKLSQANAKRARRSKQGRSRNVVIPQCDMVTRSVCKNEDDGFEYYYHCDFESNGDFTVVFERYYKGKLVYSVRSPRYGSDD